MSRLFPITLLDDSADARLSYFAEISIEHPHLKRITKQLWRALNSRVKDSLIFLYGPAGVGKTTACEHVIAEIIKKNSMQNDVKQRKEVPVVFVDAAAPDNNRFDWKYFYQHSIYSMESSLTRRKNPKFTRYNPRLAPALFFNQNLKPCEYRNHLIAALRKYLPIAFFIDEAQHLAKVSPSERLLNQMDILKTISKFSKTKIVLIGPYDLLPFRNLSGQLSRRSLDVHFPRCTTSEEDLISFQSAILTLQKKLPLSVEPDLISHWKYIYTKSVGCVGIMKDWLLRALETAVDENKETISFEILSECALSDNQCINIALEIMNGKQLVGGTEKSFEDLQEKVGFRIPNQKKAPAGANDLLISHNQGKTQKTHPGRPKAKRHKVGGSL